MRKTSLILIHCVLFLAGCWDQQQLKDNRLAVGIGLDATENGELMQITDLRVPKQDSGGTGRPAFTSIILKSTGATVRQSRMDINKKIAGNYAPNKVSIYVLGEELAKKDIYPIFDVLYRYPRNSLGAKLAITKGKAEDIFSLRLVEETLVSEALLRLIENAEEDTLIPEVSLQSVRTMLFNEGQDFALPLINKSDDDQITISGMSLFHGRKYTGVTLSEEDSSLLLLLNNEQRKFTRFIMKVNPEEEEKINQFVNFHAFIKTHDLKVKVDSNNRVKVDIKLKLKLHIAEYPNSGLKSEKEIKTLTKKINEQLKKKVKHVISELQKANSDYLGVGRRIKAYHPKEWKSMDWEKLYPTIEINTKIETEIVETGITE